MGVDTINIESPSRVHCHPTQTSARFATSRSTLDASVESNMQARGKQMQVTKHRRIEQPIDRMGDRLWTTISLSPSMGQKMQISLDSIREEESVNRPDWNKQTLNNAIHPMYKSTNEKLKKKMKMKR